MSTVQHKLDRGEAGYKETGLLRGTKCLTHGGGNGDEEA